MELEKEGILDNEWSYWPTCHYEFKKSL